MTFKYVDLEKQIKTWFIKICRVNLLMHIEVNNRHVCMPHLVSFIDEVNSI